MTEQGMVTIPKLTCQQCGHVWIPRVAHPHECPVCQSRAWNTTKKGGRP